MWIPSRDDHADSHSGATPSGTHRHIGHDEDPLTIWRAVQLSLSVAFLELGELASDEIHGDADLHAQHPKLPGGMS